MSPLPHRARASEYAVKIAHAALREVGSAPEQVRARSLAREAAHLPAPTGPRITFFTPRDWAVHVQWEAMMAQALRLRCAEVSFVACGGGLEICDRINTWEGPPMPCRTCTHYVSTSLAAHGFAPSTLRNGWAESAEDWPELDALGMDELRDVEWAGVPIGRLVEIPVKWFLMGASSDPLSPLTTRRFLRSARRVIAGAAEALDRARPDIVVLLNGLFFFESIVSELCWQRDIDVVTYERGFAKETLLLRRHMPACLGDVSDLFSDRRDMPLTPAEEQELDDYLDDRLHGRRTIDRYWQDVQFDAPDAPHTGRLVTLFTNLTWDSAVIGQEVAFESMQQWLLYVIDAFARRPDHELIVRIHPAEVKLPGKQTREPLGGIIAAAYPELPPNVRVVGGGDPISSYPLMDASDLGLVFTSTTGLELALRGKPVLVAGRTHYRGQGFTLDPATAHEFEAMLDAALDDPLASAPDVDLVRRYAYLFFLRAPVASPGVEEHVPGLARITIRSLEELRAGRDPEVDRLCDFILEPGRVHPAPAGRRDLHPAVGGDPSAMGRRSDLESHPPEGP